jgi:hypothetical protein
VASMERLLAVGPGTKQHEVVRAAGAPQPQATRGPDMVELKATEAVVRDSQAGKDAAAVASPHLRPHGR